MIIKQYFLYFFCYSGYCVIRMPRFATILSVCSVRSPPLSRQDSIQTACVYALVSEEDTEEEDKKFFVCDVNTPKSDMFKHGGDYIGFFTIQYSQQNTETVHHVFVNCV